MQPHTLTISNELFFSEIKQVLSRNGAVTIRAKGESMYPFILNGSDQVVVCKSGDIGVGDIVLAELADNRYVLHRVYRAQGDCFVLMGDGNLQATERCPIGKILGKVVQIRRGDRLVDCTSKAAHRKAAVWRRLLPVRRYLLFALRRCSRHNNHSG